MDPEREFSGRTALPLDLRTVITIPVNVNSFEMSFKGDFNDITNYIEFYIELFHKLLGVIRK